MTLVKVDLLCYACIKQMSTQTTRASLWKKAQEMSCFTISLFCALLCFSVPPLLTPTSPHLLACLKHYNKILSVYMDLKLSPSYPFLFAFVEHLQCPAHVFLK